MLTMALTDRYATNLHGVLSCYDRIIVTGTLPGACYAGGMTSFLYSRGIRIFDYPRFAEPLRDRIRERAQQVCETAGIEIEHVNRSHIRKEELVARVLAVRGDAPGLVHVISAMESCPSYKPWLDKSNGHVYLRADQGKCLHYYFYFIDEEFGLCYLRVPTWAPFALQFYCNGHSALACSLKREGIDFVQEDNAYLRIADLARAHLLGLHALEGNDSSAPLVYNLGNGQGFSVRQVVEVARKLTGHPIPVVESPRRAGDPAVLIASSEKIRRDLGWKPQFPDLESIVESAWQWHRKHPAGYTT